MNPNSLCPGLILLFAGTGVPEGFLVCDGSIVAISQYPQLFSKIKALFGGDGTTTFGLPSLPGEAGARYVISAAAGPPSIDSLQLGFVTYFGGSWLPLGFLACNGATVSISDHPQLFKVLGTTYGGDGTTTFGLPNLPATKFGQYLLASLSTQPVMGQFFQSTWYVDLDDCLPCTGGTQPTYSFQALVSIISPAQINQQEFSLPDMGIENNIFHVVLSNGGMYPMRG